MTYAKKMSQMGDLILGKHITSIKKLKGGESYIIEGARDTLASFRYYLYTWMDLGGLKGQYKVKKEGEGKLKVIKVGIPKLRGRYLDPLTDIEEFVIEKLGEVDEMVLAREVIELARKSGEIREEDVGEIWKEWMGGAARG